MRNYSAILTSSRKASDTWSTKARSGSPKPMPDTCDTRSTRSLEIRKENTAVKTQNDLLYGVGSQFPTIDDSIKHKDVHPNL